MIFKKKQHHKKDENAVNSDILDARKEQIKLIIKKNKKIILLSLIALFLLIVGYFSFQSYQKSKEEKYSAIFQQAIIDMEQNNINSAANTLKELSDNESVPSGVRALASLKYASILLSEEKIDEAADCYIKINKTKKFDPYIRELAGLLALKSMIDANSSVFYEKINILAEDLEKSSKILKYYVTEQRAIFEWMRGNNDQAQKIFKDLIDNPEVPQSVKYRSEETCNSFHLNDDDKKIVTKEKIKESSASKHKPQKTKKN